MSVYPVSFQNVYKAVLGAHVVILQEKIDVRRVGWQENKGGGSNSKSGKNEAKIKIQLSEQNDKHT